MEPALKQIAEKVATKKAGQRTEYCWFFLREAFPGKTWQAENRALSSKAKKILAVTGH